MGLTTIQIHFDGDEYELQVPGDRATNRPPHLVLGDTHFIAADEGAAHKVLDAVARWHAEVYRHFNPGCES